MIASFPKAFAVRRGSIDLNIIENHVDQDFANIDMDKFTQFDFDSDMLALKNINLFWKGGHLAELKTLPYAEDSLDPHMDARLVDWLYNTNHKDNVSNL